MGDTWTSGIALKACTLASVVGVGGAFVLASCREDDGCAVEQNPPLGVFDDTPLPRLCASDTLQLSPGSATISLPDGSTSVSSDGGGPSDAGIGPEGGGGVGAVASDSVQFAVLGRRDTGQPHEAAHIDVRVATGDGLIRLSATTDTSVPGGCTSISAVALQCILDSNGLAGFQVTAVPGANGTATVQASSGPLSQSAFVHVGAPTSTIASLAFLFDDTHGTVAQGPSPMACGPTPPAVVACLSVVSRPITLESLIRTASPGPDGGALVDASAAPPPGPTQVNLAVVPKTAAASAIWLSNTDKCDGQLRSITMTFDATSPLSNTAYVCSDGSSGVATLVATFPGIIGSAVSSIDVTLPPVPAIVMAAPGGDAGSTYTFTVKDCRGVQIQGAHVVVPGAQGTTASDGTVSLPFTPADAGTVSTLQADNPLLVGAPSTCGGTP